MRYKVDIEVVVECDVEHCRPHNNLIRSCERDWQSLMSRKHPHVYLTYQNRSPNGNAMFSACSENSLQLEMFLNEYNGSDTTSTDWMMTEAHLHCLKEALDMIDNSTAAIQELNLDNEYEDHMGALNHASFAMRADLRKAVDQYMNGEKS